MKRFYVGAIALAFAFSATPAFGATVEELQAMIAQLQAQLSALSGGSMTGPSKVFNTDLTLGSTGADVTELQQYLVANGHLQMPAGVAYGYFGPLTQSAVAKWQASVGITPAVGYFGPISRAKINSMVGVGTGTGTGTGTGSTGTLQGGAGSVDSYTLVSSLNSEEVGEGQNDVEVAGLEVEVDEGSDIEITAVRLNFTKGTGATRDLHRYADEVSIWLDGKEVARLDADEFEKSAYTKTVSLDRGAIISAGDTGELVVALSGVSNLDSNDAGDEWTVDFEQVRFRDASGASISEDPNTSARTFSFEDFASATDVELRANLDNSSPDAGVVNVHASNDTNGVELLVFTLEARGDSDILITDLPITLESVGANLDVMVKTLYLEIDGEQFSESVSSASTAASITFDDIDFTISAGDTVTVVVSADINDLESTFGDGDTLAASYTASNREMADVDDENGDALASADRTGTALGDAMAFYDVGIMVNFVSASQSVNSGNSTADDTGTFVIKFEVEAFDGTVYVSRTAAPTIASTIPDATVATDGIRYLLDLGGTATVASPAPSSIVTYTTGNGASAGGNNTIELADGESTQVTVTVTRTNNSSDDVGLYRMLLKALGWNTDASATFNVYDFDLDDYKTDPISLN